MMNIHYQVWYFIISHIKM